MAHAVINTASSGDNTIVAAPAAAQKIRVLNYTLIAAGAVVVQWFSGASPTTPLSGPMSLITGVPLSPASPPMRVSDRGDLISAGLGQALVLNLGGAVQVSGHLEYEIKRD